MAALRREAERLVGSARSHLRERGPRYVALDAIDLARSMVTYPLAARRHGRRTFALDGRRHRYHVHHYNRAWRNERTVELALAFDFLERRAGTRTLEVGNVLGHYGMVGHDVLDKYEQAPGVINADVVSFRPEHPYETIVSLSTLEHVGWDERPRQDDKTLRAVENLHQMLAPGGELLLTAPVGQNPFLDRYIVGGLLPLEEMRFLRRVNPRNEWVEVSRYEIDDARYGRPYRNANVLLVAVGRVPPGP